MEPGGGRTAVKAVPAKLYFNTNTGLHTIESKQPLQPLEVTINEPNRVLILKGNSLTITQYFKSKLELTKLIQGVYFVFPPLLNVEFMDPPLIERVDGEIGGVPFGWELQEVHTEFRTTNQEKQESAFISSWEKIGLLSVPTNTRLFAAIHFYYVAVRLERQASVVGEFMSEMILNLSKVLEVLFPPRGNGRTRDAARQGLSNLGFSDVEVEADYIPCMALRNEIDVGHVDLGLFEPEQLTLIHGYMRQAEGAFHELLYRVLTKVESGEFSIKPYEQLPVRSEAVAVVEKLSKYSGRYRL